MRNHKGIAMVALVVLLALGAGGTAAWADSSARPLKGSFSGSGFDFHGQLTHLGKFSAHISKLEPTPSGTLVEEWTATAANGDTLHVTGESRVTGFDTSTGLYTFAGTRTIQGGTGRFAGATGTFQATGETAGDFSTYHGDFSGTIGY